jgi:hypothetical protein
MVGVDERAELAARIARGDYEVDAEAVADAILRRWRRGRSVVLVAAEPLDPPPVGADQDEPAATGHDVA